MIDFFDEEFPLTKRQEEEMARQAAQALASQAITSEIEREAMKAVAEHELERLSIKLSADSSSADSLSADSDKKASEAQQHDERQPDDADSPQNIDAAKDAETTPDSGEPTPQDSLAKDVSGDNGEYDRLYAPGQQENGEVTADQTDGLPESDDFKASRSEPENTYSAEPEKNAAENKPSESEEDADDVIVINEDAEKKRAETAAEKAAEAEKEKTDAKDSTNNEASPKQDPILAGLEALQPMKDIDAEDAALRAELAEIVEKLDNMERAVSAMEIANAGESDSGGFSYEYDDRYFAEEETPAYKYPELYKKAEQARESSRPPMRKSRGVITINTKTLIKVGAVVAAAAAAVKLLGKKDD